MPHPTSTATPGQKVSAAMSASSELRTAQAALSGRPGEPGAPNEAELRERFQHMLNAALTQGRFSWRGSQLGLSTIAAVAAVADDHPDASVEQIAAAYDAFAREHGTVYPPIDHRRPRRSI
ncbi:MAG: hypothetical protein AB7I50_13535 [Vicinamibacterales bacterium]